MLDDLKDLLDKLGYHCEPVHFTKSVPYATLRGRLEGQFSDTEVSQVLRHFPDLFVMNHKMVHGIFFIKVLDDLDALTAEATATYEKFYPKDILLVTITKSGNTRRIESRWIGQKGRSILLTKALMGRFNYVPPKAAIEQLSKTGWLL